MRVLHTELLHELDGLLDHLKLARKSRERAAAARGLFDSGSMKGWIAVWDVDVARLSDLTGSLPATSDTYSAMSQHDLESELIALKKTALVVADLRAKYRASLEEDRKQVDENRARMMHPPRQ